MEGIKFSKVLNSTTNSLDFFLISKFFFIRKPLSIFILKIFIKPVSLNLFNLQMRKFFRKKLLKSLHDKIKKFFMGINFRQNIMKDLYRIDLLFPEAKFNFFKIFPYNKKNLTLKKPILQFCKKENFSFLPPQKKCGQSFPSLQKLIILKKLKTINHINSSKNLIQYYSYPTFCFTNFFLKIHIFLNFLKRQPFVSFLKPNFNQIGYYNLFELNNYNSHEIFDLFFESRSEKILSSFRAYDSLNLNLTHCFESYKTNFYLLLICELAKLFSPRISDKIFFKHRSFYFIRKNTSNRRSRLSRKFFQIKNNSFRIIIESNFRIYVYKKKKTKIEILHQFSEILYQLPNLFVGNLSVKSINKAFKNGISAENILTFIRNNLHSICKKVPANVEEQIKIWEVGKKNNFISRVVLTTNLSTLLKKIPRQRSNEIIVIKSKKYKMLVFKIKTY